jgi:hypothetical protein
VEAAQCQMYQILLLRTDTIWGPCGSCATERGCWVVDHEKEEDVV